MTDILAMTVYSAVCIGLGFTGGYSLSRHAGHDERRRLRAEVALYRAAAERWRKQARGEGVHRD